MRKAIIVDMLISCPNDVDKDGYPKSVENVIDQINNSYGYDKNIIVRSLYWKKNITPEYGTAQNIINRHIVNTSDAVIAIFKHSFGSKTKDFDSGTEEEIEKMILNNRRIFLYFIDTKADLDDVDFEQYQNVKAFQDKYRNRGIYSLVKSKKDLEQSLTGHLFSYLQSLTQTSHKKYDIEHDAIDIKYEYLDSQRDQIKICLQYKFTSTHDNYRYFLARMASGSKMELLEVIGGKVIDNYWEKEFKTTAIRLKKTLNEGESDTLSMIYLLHADGDDDCTIGRHVNQPVKKLTICVNYHDAHNPSECYYEIVDDNDPSSNYIEKIQIKDGKAVIEIDDLMVNKRYTLRWDFN